MSALSIPSPKALVATTTGTSPPMKRSCALPPRRLGELPVVDPDAVAERGEVVGDALAVGDGGGVDDARPRHLGEHLAERRELAGVVVDRHHLEVEIGAVDPGVDDVEVAAGEPVADVVDHLVGGGGGQRQQRRPAEGVERAAELEKGRPEVVPPLEMQCASSTTKRSTSTPARPARNSACASRSGVT
jgi:hypothetical protein